MRQESRKLTNAALATPLEVGQEVIVCMQDGAPIVARVVEVKQHGIWFKLDAAQHFAPLERVWL